MDGPFTYELHMREGERERGTTQIGFKKARMPPPLRLCSAPAAAAVTPASLPRLVENLIRFFTLRLSCFTYIAWRRGVALAAAGDAVVV